MKFVRDELGRIIQIVKEESDGDFNMETILKIVTDEEISKEKEITARQKNRCDFWKTATNMLYCGNRRKLYVLE